jgi:hypothetical protein
MIDVRFMVPIVRKEDSSNHSHDHTHDRYHLGRQRRNDYPDHSLPQVSAPEHTHDHSHALRIAALLGRIVAAFEHLGQRDHDPIRPSPVDDATGGRPYQGRTSGRGSTIARPSRPKRSSSRARYATREAALAAGWAEVGFEPLAGSDRADMFDPFENRVELRRPATWIDLLEARAQTKSASGGRGPSMSAGEWRMDRRGALHISLPGGCTVTFRSVTARLGRGLPRLSPCIGLALRLGAAERD